MFNERKQEMYANEPCPDKASPDKGANTKWGSNLLFGQFSPKLCMYENDENWTGGGDEGRPLRPPESANHVQHSINSSFRIGET